MGKLVGHWDDNEEPTDPRYMKIDDVRYPVCIKTCLKVERRGNGERRYRYTEDFSKWPEWVARFVSVIVETDKVVLVDERWRDARLCSVRLTPFSLPLVDFTVLDPPGEPVLIR